MDLESIVVPVAKQPSSYRSQIAKQQNQNPEKHSSQSSQFPVAKETNHSSQTDSQRTSLSDLRSQYWELLHATGQVSSNSNKPVPLISQIAREKTVIGEDSELKSRIASYLGKILIGCYEYRCWLLWLCSFLSRLLFYSCTETSIYDVQAQRFIDK